MCCYKSDKHFLCCAYTKRIYSGHSESPFYDATCLTTIHDKLTVGLPIRTAFKATDQVVLALVAGIGASRQILKGLYAEVIGTLYEIVPSLIIRVPTIAWATSVAVDVI